MSGINLSVLIPVRDENENLVPLVDELEIVLRSTGRLYEIILIDDGSRDGSHLTLERLCAERPSVKAIFFRGSAGQTAAIDAGFRDASGEILITLDGDRQNDPADIPPMIALLEEGNDCVVGWRRHRRDGFWLRRFPSRVANALIRALWRSRTHDLGCALKVYRRDIARELRLYGEMHRFVSLVLEGMGARVAERVVNHRARESGRSKYGLSRTLKVVLDLVTLWFLQSYRTKPIYVFGGAGAGFAGLSVLLAGAALWEKLALGTKVHRNPLFIVSIFLAVLGTQFLLMGLIAELVTRTYFETGQRPYSIRRRIGFGYRPRPVLDRITS